MATQKRKREAASPASSAPAEGSRPSWAREEGLLEVSTSLRRKCSTSRERSAIFAGTLGRESLGRFMLRGCFVHPSLFIAENTPQNLCVCPSLWRQSPQLHSRGGQTINILVNEAFKSYKSYPEIISYLSKSKNGLENLKKTYNDCAKSQARINIIIDDINRFISKKENTINLSDENSDFED